MRLLTRGRSGPRRKGVILLVVLSMLTLFALVGVSFVLVSGAQATSGRIALEAENVSRPDIDPEAAFALFLGQLLYDVPDDADGVFSAMRGQSLARNMYGWNPAALNDKPYSGTGRLHTPTTQSSMPTQTPSRYKFGLGSTDAGLMNYRFFPGDVFPPSPGPFDFAYSPYPAGSPYLRDPEKPGFRQGFSDTPKPYAGGFGVPYTYPDHNNFYLAEVDPATGQVIVPSFHRPYLFGPLELPDSPSGPNPIPAPANPYPFPGTAANTWNPNWKNGEGKYLTLRPRPFDQGVDALGNRVPVNGGFFPFPLDRGGDVKNLDNAPGGADSIWIDIGAPVMTAADGRKYKMLVAPLIVALDGRIDLNAVGNMMGTTKVGMTSVPDHRSHQGWGVWEVNPKKVLDQGTEWINLFTGSTAAGNARIRGRYDATPRNPAGNAITGSNKVRQWAQIDYNSMIDAGGAPSTGLFFQTAPANANTTASYLGYPTFAAGTFGNGGAAENTNHASIYNALRPRGTNRRFPVESFAQMLRAGGTGGDMLVSDPMRLLQTNLVSAPGALRSRNLVTLLSVDLDRPGATPYLAGPSATDQYPYRFVLNPPVMGSNVYQPGGKANAQVPPLSSAGTAGGEFDASWRSTLAARLKLDLYRNLSPYPTPDPATGLMNDTPPMMGQPGPVTKATQDRQAFARDIFNTLVAVTGAVQAPAGSPVTPAQAAYDTYGKSSPEYRGTRYLAQLAVNIVDYMDSDDISTPFNWANFMSTNMTKDIVNEWVFGVETPRLVLNELYISYDNDPASISVVAGKQKLDLTKNYVVNVWAELHNPMPNDSQPDTTARLSTNAGANLAYRILLADQSPNATVPGAMFHPGNSLGDPDFGQPANTPPGAIYGQAASSVRSVLDSWGDPAKAPQSVAPGGGQFDWSSNGNTTKSGGFYVIGPQSTFVDDAQDNPNLNTTATSAKMSYTIKANSAGAETKPQPMVLLQRLINPSMVLDNNTTLGNGNPNPNYNPYVTIDYVENSAAFIMDGRRFTSANLNGGAAASGVMTVRNSVGRNQPLTAAVGQRGPQNPATPAAKQPKHTLSRQNCTYDTQAALNAATTDTTLKIPFDWLTHLDRLPTNPLELLQVGDTRPCDLTQRFYTGGKPHMHIAPWIDNVPSGAPQSSRLYRFFEFVTTPTPATSDPNAAPGVTLPTAGGRVVGKVNINAMRSDDIDANKNPISRVFRAVADAQSGNKFVGPAATPDQYVDAVYQNFVARRGDIKLGRAPAPTDQTIADLAFGLGTIPDKPIWSLALGQAAADGTVPLPDPFLRTATKTRGVENTLFQTVTVTTGGSANTTLLLEPNPDPQAQGHPYLQKELLRKIYGSITTRSNVFAVWATVGYFECDPSTTPPRLGAEIGFAENRHVRHRMFAIVDRTQMQAWPTLASGSPTPTVSLTAAVAAGSGVTCQLSADTFSHPNALAPIGGSAYQWSLQAGAILVIDPNTDNEETVVVQSRTGLGRFTANITKAHSANAPVVARANPGPLQRYDPRQDRDVVPYFGLID